jgi:hypothetical protein
VSRQGFSSLKLRSDFPAGRTLPFTGWKLSVERQMQDVSINACQYLFILLISES